MSALDCSGSFCYQFKAGYLTLHSSYFVLQHSVDSMVYSSWFMGVKQLTMNNEHTVPAEDDSRLTNMCYDSCGRG